MSKFQSTISTIAALGTIAVTATTAYKFLEGQKQNNVKQQIIIEDLKRQLENKKEQAQPALHPTQIPMQPTVANPLVGGSAAAPPGPPAAAASKTIKEP